MACALSYSGMELHNEGSEDEPYRAKVLNYIKVLPLENDRILGQLRQQIHNNEVQPHPLDQDFIF